MVLNAVVKEFPAQELTTSQLQAYLGREASNWVLVHGFRYAAFACVILFAATLYSRCATKLSGRPVVWAVVGLLGAAIWVANGIVTNGIEIIAFIDGDRASKQPELFWLLFDLTRVLFTAEIAAWSVTIFGFSMAGRQAAAIPVWTCILGFFAAAAGMVSSLFIVSVIAGGWAIPLADLATLVSLAWFLCVGVAMLLPRPKT